MDKNLKKLSRVELLELMISLSEDYEELADENNRLKKMLSVQRLPRSTKVGSIAEAALVANGYFESAQRSADEYLREIKHLRDELARRVEAQDRRPAANRAAGASELQQAQVQARQVVARAHSQADAIIADARSRADEVLADANRRAHAIISQAQQAQQAAGRASGYSQPSAQAPGPATGQLAASPSFSALNLSPAASSSQLTHTTSDPAARLMRDLRTSPADQGTSPMSSAAAELSPRRGRHTRTTERRPS